MPRVRLDRAPRLRLPMSAAVVAWLAVSALPAAAQDALTKDQIRRFLLTAAIVDSRPVGKGKTSPWRLTLREGALTHDAAFQSIEVRKHVMRFETGGSELSFADSYHFNVAAFALAELLGLDGMMPVTVERAWRSKPGALSWWIEAQFDEQERLKRRIHPPDIQPWNQQMYRMRVFSELVYDTDRNLGNVLITEDWKIWMIDFTRAFRIWRDLKSASDLVMCDRRLLDKLRELDARALAEATRPHLSEFEIDALMARRDKIVAHFERLIATRGEAAVLY